MKNIYFDYRMIIKYSEVVNLCHFVYKCIPKDTARQKVIYYNVELEPSVQTNVGTDSFGNIKLYGTIKNAHRVMEYHISGEICVEQILYEDKIQEEKLGIYKYDYGKAIAGDQIKAYYKGLISNSLFEDAMTDYEKAIYVMQCLYKDFEYKRNVTNNETTAEEAFILRGGVCQDIAHIYIAILKLMRIPARYVTGLMLGEGQSHAWVEFVWNGKWIGVDPTNNLLIDENYIKLADGRDSSDCEINRGIIYGGGTQNQSIAVRVWKEEQ